MRVRASADLSALAGAAGADGQCGERQEEAMNVYGLRVWDDILRAHARPDGRLLRMPLEPLCGYRVGDASGFMLQECRSGR